MDDVFKQITFSGERPARTVLRMVEHHIEKWIWQEQHLLFLPRVAFYSAHFDNVDSQCVSCHLEIRIGSREWNAIEEGRTIQDAVLNTLRRLKRKGSRVLPPGELTSGGLAEAPHAAGSVA